MKEYYSISEVANLLSVSKETLRRWDANGKLKPMRHPINEYRVYHHEQLKIFDSLEFLFEDNIENECNPNHAYSVVELFAGAGGLAVGLEQAGLSCVLLNDIDHWSCETLKKNKPHWNVVEGDISLLNEGEIDNYNLERLHQRVDVVTGGFPCQSFSFAGKKLGLEDTRGTLFYEFAKAVKIISPKIFIAENVRGLLTHDGGKTLEIIIDVFEQLGYRIEKRLLKAIFYKVPQKRERLIIVGIRNDIDIEFDFPKPHNIIYTVGDALKAGTLYDCDVPKSDGIKYSEKKEKVMSLVPEGGYWKDLPVEVQKSYMKKSYYLGGGKTGMARRMSWSEPSLTLTCNPSQMETDRCHPEENRPFTVREYARIQTFPDNWEFMGPVSQQYKQIGNAVPVNMAKEIGYSVIRFLNEAYHRYGYQEIAFNLNQLEMAID